MSTLADALLYGIVDLGYVAERDVERVANEMIAGGVDVLQLRAKERSSHVVLELARRLADAIKNTNVPLIINDHPEIALAVGAQGAHIGQDDGPIAHARQPWRSSGTGAGGENGIIGRSTHSLAQAIAAENEGADYIGFGPLFRTATKPGRPAIGIDNIRRVNDAVRIPVFCIGGIDRENLDTVLDAGARRVVIVSAILKADNVTAYCRALKSRLENRRNSATV